MKKRDDVSRLFFDAMMYRSSRDGLSASALFDILSRACWMTECEVRGMFHSKRAESRVTSVFAARKPWRRQNSFLSSILISLGIQK